MSKSMILNMQNLCAFLFKTTRWSLWCFQDHPMMDFGKILLALWGGKELGVSCWKDFLLQQRQNLPWLRECRPLRCIDKTPTHRWWELSLADSRRAGEVQCLAQCDRIWDRNKNLGFLQLLAVYCCTTQNTVSIEHMSVCKSDAADMPTCWGTF